MAKTEKEVRRKMREIEKSRDDGQLRKPGQGRTACSSG
jgi:hypothetical protein